MDIMRFFFLFFFFSSKFVRVCRWQCGVWRYSTVAGMPGHDAHLRQKIRYHFRSASISARTSYVRMSECVRASVRTHHCGWLLAASAAERTDTVPSLEERYAVSPCTVCSYIDIIDVRVHGTGEAGRRWQRARAHRSRVGLCP